MKIAIIGNLCNLGYLTLLSLKSLNKKDISVDLFISANELNTTSDPREENINAFEEDNIFFWEYRHDLSSIEQKLINNHAKYTLYENNKISILRLASHVNNNYDYVIGVTLGSIIALFSRKKFLWFATGSDLREWIFRKNKVSSLLLRLVAKKSHRIISGNDPGTFKSIEKLGLEYKHIAFEDFPVNFNNIIRFKKEKDFCKNSKFIIFNPANQLWDIKGNDKLIKAVAKLINKNYNLELWLLDRGNDSELSKNLVKKLKIDDHVIWNKTLSKEELYIAMCKADVIADQFILGDVGGISREACCLGKPVIAYLANKNDKRPIINSYSVNEICAAILCCMDEKNYFNITRKAVLYAEEHYRIEKFGTKIFNIIEGENNVYL